MTPMRSRSRARYVAKKHAPTFLQGFDDVRDLITPIQIDKFDPSEQPAIYYSVCEDREFWYVLYCVFHRHDWSGLPWPIKSLDEHNYDFEGVLRGVPKGTLPAWCATVAHSELKFNGDDPGVYHIESGGHGIHPYPISLNNFIEYRRYILIDMETRRKSSWFAKLRPIFNREGVNMPWQWSHRGKWKGLIYSDPAKLRTLAKREGLL